MTFGCVVVQGMLQAPQFALLVFVSTHEAAQSVGADIGQPD